MYGLVSCFRRLPVSTVLDVIVCALLDAFKIDHHLCGHHSILRVARRLDVLSNVLNVLPVCA